MRTLFLFIALSILISCKKKEDCPAPKVGKIITNDVPGEYSGYFKTTIQYNHSFNQQDTSIISYLSFYNTPVSNAFGSPSTVDVADVSGYSAYNYSQYYSVSIDKYLANPPNIYKSIFNNLIYYFSSPKFGTITLNDNRLGGDFTNSNSIPLSFSNSTPYIITLNNVSNCTNVLIEIWNGSEIVSRSVLISNPTAKLFASEFVNTLPGSQAGLDISLINSKDTIINGFKFKIEKIVKHGYTLTYTN